MKKNSNISNSIFDSGINVGAAFLKGTIRQYFNNLGKCKSVYELLENGKERVLKLEIANKLKIQQETPLSNQTLGWETDTDAIERAKRLPPRDWVMQGIIPEGSVCNVQSPEKAGKSTLAKQIAYDYANATNTLDLPNVDRVLNKDTKAFIYDAELDDEDIQERYDELGDTKVSRWPNAYFKSPGQLVEHIYMSVSGVNANTLVVVDNVTTVCPNFHKTDVDEVQAGCNKLQSDFCKRGFRLTIIFIHHTKASAKGESTSDRAGSVEWGRVSKLNLSLRHCNLGPEYKVLKVLNSRGRNTLLTQGKVAVLKLIENPYLHFHFEHIAQESEVCNKKKIQDNQASANDAPLDRKLTAEEESYICEHYKPGEIGLGKLAKHILLERGGIELNEKNRNQMKNVIQRFLMDKGLYKGQNC